MIMAVIKGVYRSITIPLNLKFINIWNYGVNLLKYVEKC